MPNPNTIVAAARSWLGTPWHHQGRLKHVGVDCIGLAVGVAREIGLTVEDQTDYGREPDADLLLEKLHLHCERVDDWQPGDILLFAISGPRARHVGFATDIGMIHAHAPARRVVEHGIDATWRQRIIGAWRLPDHG